MSGSQLTAKLTLTGDATGVVGAANEGAASLDRLKTSAAQAGAAGGAMAPQYDAAAVAVRAQAAASTQANAALTASGAAKVEEIARLTQMASASSATTASITALSAAHGQYNSTVNAARALLASGVLSQAQYGEAVAAASAQLTLATAIHSSNSAAIAKETGGSAALKAAQAELGEGAEEAGMHFGHMGLALERLGAASGLGMVSARTLEESFRGLSGVIAAIGPEGAILLGVAATFGVLIAASASYAAIYQKLDQVVAQQNNQLGQTHAQYVGLVSDLQSVTGETERASVAMAETLAGSNVATGAWNSLALAAQKLANSTGTDLSAALQQLAKDEQDPAQSAQQLAAQIGLLDEKTVKLITDLQAQGDLKGAQVAFAQAVGSAYAHAADNTSDWSKYIRLLEDDFSGLYTWMGKVGALSSSMLPWGMFPSTKPTDPQQASAAAAAQRNQLAGQAQGMISDEDTNGHSAEMVSNLADQSNAWKLLNAGLLTYDQYSARIADDDAKQLQMFGQTAVAKKQLDAIDQAHLATIKHLIEAGPEQIALSQADAAALQAEASASDGTAESIKGLQDQYDVQKKIQPYITAHNELVQLYEKGIITVSAYTKMDAALNADIVSITKSTQAQIAAQAQLNAMQSIQSKFSGLSSIQNSDIRSPTTDASFIAQTSTQIFNANAAAETEWVNQTRNAIDQWLIVNSDGSQEAIQKWQQFRDQLGLIFNSDMAKFYQDDLARRTDWQAGVTRGLDSLEKSTADWATTSQNLVSGLSSNFENDLATMVVTGQNTMTQFFQWFAEQIVKMIYQEYLASSMNAMFGFFANGLGDFMGFGGAGAGTGGAGVGTGMHDGGIVGRDASFTRDVPMALFAHAPRFHWGGLAGDEVPIIAQKGERVLNIAQTRAYDAGLSRAMVMQAPANGNAVPFTVNIHEAPGTRASVKQGRGPDGTFSLEVMIDTVDKGLAQRSHKGRSALVQSMENTHGIKRSPMG